ncbi:MAG: sugar-binding protein [Kiritimatiellae bacterium]|nr:sugar-binding protein [Kiritimatiellia bacterium]
MIRLDSRNRNLCAVLSLLVAPLIYGQEVPSARAPETKTPPVIDGLPDDEVWKSAQEYGLTVLQRNKEGQRPLQSTTFRALADEEALYLSVRCAEPAPQLIKAQMGRHDGGISHDDSIEVFLDPTGLGVEYYHLAWNTQGFQFDLYAGEKGNTKTISFDALIPHAVRVGQAEWTLEAAIPFAALRLTDKAAVSPKWRFNLTRTRVAGNAVDLYTWAPLRYGFHEPDRFGALQVEADIPWMRYAFQFGALARQVYSKADGSLAADLTMPIENRTGTNRDLRVEAFCVEAPAAKSTGTLSLAAGTSERVTMRGLTFAGSGKRDVAIEVYEASGKRPLATLRQAVQIEYRLLEIDVRQPFYRNNIYPDETVNAIAGRVTLLDSTRAKGGSLSIGLSGDGIASQSSDAPLGAGLSVDFQFPVQNLPIGSYRLTAVAKDSAGTEIGRMEETIRRLPESTGSITRVDRDLNLVANGRPILVAGWYAYGYLMGHAQSAEARSSRQLNLTLGLSPEQAHRKGMLGIVSVECAILCPEAVPLSKQDVDLPPAYKEKIRETVERYRHHPGLGGWYLSDEPGSQGVSPVFLKRVYEYMRELDPYHVTVIVDLHPEEFIDCTDVYSPHPFLTPMEEADGRRWMRRPMTTIRDEMREVLELGKRRKALWVTPGLHRDIVPTASQANFEETRCMLYTALANGSKGFMPYTRGEGWQSYETRYAVESFFEELYNLEPILTAEGGVADVTAVSDGKAVDCLLKRVGKEVYLIAVNTSPEPKEAVITSDAMKPCRALTVLRDGATVPVENGSIRDRFPGYGTRLYTSARIFPYMATLSDVREEIEWRKRHTRDSLIFNDRSVIVRTSDGRKAYIPLNTHNGVTDHPGWIATTPPKDEPLWLEYSWRKPLTIGRVVVYSDTLTAFDVEAFAGGTWKAVGEARDVRAPSVTLTFPPVETVKMRIVIRGGVAEINEVAVYAE